ncbi:MAG: phosphoglycerate kinase [candidate division Zixibacteria bacterium]|nr:phosphoglycerate kinase [candidate division Zixibacteria bacterium]
MSKVNIDDIELTGRKVLTRVDFNVPLKEGVVGDDTRIKAALPTIMKIISSGGRAILMSHLGRPKGQIKPEFSLKPVAEKLSGHLDIDVQFANDCIGDQAQNAARSLQNGQVLLLENLRFHKEETDNEAGFARELASLGDVFVNDAFGTAHRAHASTEGITKFISPAVAGYLMRKEIKYLGQALANPERPFVAIIGGAKISGKIDVIHNLLKKVDSLLIGGGMIFTFYKAQGLPIGKSLLEQDKINEAEGLLKLELPAYVQMVLPEDILVADNLEVPFKTRTVSNEEIPDDWLGVDIGSKTRRKFIEIIKRAKTIVWNGPMGIFETDEFAGGTLALAKAIAEATAKGAVSIVGGGDSVAALVKMGLKDKVTHASTGGGASLEFLEGKTLPGLAALTERD